MGGSVQSQIIQNEKPDEIPLDKLTLGSEDDTGLPPIRLIPFKAFKEHNTFPRFPDNSDLNVNLLDIDMNNSIIVFISHCWLRGWSGAVGWDGRKHPDNANDEKYKLCVSGIEKINNAHVIDIENCYVWLDYGCINQDCDPAGELKQLDKIMEYSDYIFTPIAGQSNWDLPTTINNWYVDYRAEGWVADKHGYVNRGWCRVEMFYAANIPVSSSLKLSRLKNALHHHLSSGRRPHFLYSQYEVSHILPPVCLPPLQNSHFDQYHPAKGFLSVESDRQKISELVEALIPFMTRVQVGYQGDMKDGKRNGQGQYRYSNGDTYNGEWKNDNMHGHGVYRYSNGDIYEGEYISGTMHGYGVYKHADGAVYSGMYRNGRMNGHGTYRAADGDVFEGNYEEGKWNGHGTYRYKNGAVFEGEYENGSQNGHGIYRYVNGDVFEGEYKNGVRHGHGTYRYKDGRVSVNEYVNGNIKN
jgi:hypothetical protein